MKIFPRFLFVLAIPFFLATTIYAQPAADSDDAQIVELKRKLAELEAKKNKPAAATGVFAQAPDKSPFLPLDQSNLVVKNAAGALVVADKQGKGIDGFKLSTHDSKIGTPSIAVAPDGSIHVAFVEAHRTTHANAVYSRSSTDGGKTWTEAKNLSEDMPTLDVGRCQILADSQNRAYVIWREAIAESWTGTLTTDPVSCRSNLVYRVLEAGKWSKQIPINEPCTQATQQDSTRSYFASVDAAGHAQVLWNVLPDKWHPEVLNRGGHSNGVGNGLVFQSTLDGSTAGKPREVFMNPITPPKDAWAVPSCDDLDTINGYVDSAGAPHFVAAVTGPAYGAKPHPPVYQWIENGKAAQSVTLPDLSIHAARDIPTLLVDAHGKPHMIAMFLAGEHPGFRDYPLGTQDEPVLIRGLAGLNGVLMGMQAFQGPGGRMVVVMQINDQGGTTGGEHLVSISTGEAKWSVPVNVSNNVGRKTYASTDTHADAQIVVQTGCDPVTSAAAFDAQGHLLLLVLQNEFSITHSVALGVNMATLAGSTPTLRFLKF